MNCPFCQKLGAELFHRDPDRDFFRCPHCTIIFVPRTSLISKEEEKKRYDTHQNTESDPRYRDYLLKTVRPVVSSLKAPGPGVDIGCGRTRLMETLFRQAGVEMDSYDPFYFPDEGIWTKSYTFGVLNEVIEHLADPAGTLRELRRIIRGPLFVHTKLYPEPDKFPDWFYKRDPTHVQFFSLRAFEEIGTVEVLGDDLYRIDWK